MGVGEFSSLAVRTGWHGFEAVRGWPCNLTEGTSPWGDSGASSCRVVHDQEHARPLLGSARVFAPLQTHSCARWGRELRKDEHDDHKQITIK